MNTPHLYPLAETDWREVAGFALFVVSRLAVLFVAFMVTMRYAGG